MAAVGAVCSVSVLGRSRSGHQPNQTFFSKVQSWPERDMSSITLFRLLSINQPTNHVDLKTHNVTYKTKLFNQVAFATKVNWLRRRRRDRSCPMLGAVGFLCAGCTESWAQQFSAAYQPPAAYQARYLRYGPDIQLVSGWLIILPRILSAALERMLELVRPRSSPAAPPLQPNYLFSLISSSYHNVLINDTKLCKI